MEGAWLWTLACVQYSTVHCTDTLTYSIIYYQCLLLYPTALPRPPARSRLGKLCKLRAGTFFTALTYRSPILWLSSTFSRLYLETTNNRQLRQWRFRTSYTQTYSIWRGNKIKNQLCPSMYIAQGFLGYGLCSVVCLGFPAVHCVAKQDGRLLCSAMPLFVYIIIYCMYDQIYDWLQIRMPSCTWWRRDGDSWVGKVRWWSDPVIPSSGDPKIFVF